MEKESPSNKCRVYEQLSLFIPDWSCSLRSTPKVLPWGARLFCWVGLWQLLSHWRWVWGELRPVLLGSTEKDVINVLNGELSRHFHSFWLESQLVHNSTRKMQFNVPMVLITGSGAIKRHQWETEEVQLIPLSSSEHSHPCKSLCETFHIDYIFCLCPISQ